MRQSLFRRALLRPVLCVLGAPLSAVAAAYGFDDPLYARRWAAATPSPAVSGGQVLRVVQFNILADGLSAKDRYKGGFSLVPPECLEWEYRRGRILDEIFRHFEPHEPPDIVALQEVDHYDWVAARMEERGYDGSFLKKPNSACRKSLDPSLEDGCALFWHRDSLALDEVSSVSFSHGLDASGQPAQAGSNQVAIVAGLRAVSGSAPPVVVGVSHFAAAKSAAAETVRAGQMAELCTALDAAATRLRAAGTVALLDMNASPKRSSYEPAAYAVATAPASGLRSAYQLALGAEPEWTTWKRREVELRHCIDYILVSAAVAVHRVLLPPDEADVEPTRLPGWRYPSDHVALAAEIRVGGSAER